MPPKNYLIAKFPAEKGPAIRGIVRRFDRLFHHTSWGKDGNLVNLVEFKGDICVPDSDEEGSKTRSLYDAEEVRIRMERVGASVELHIA